MIDLKIGDLAEGMNTGIGAPGADDVNRFPGYPLKRLFDFTLNSGLAGLVLPAGEICPFVLKIEPDIYFGQEISPV